MRYLLIIFLSSSLLYAADQKEVKDKHDERASLLSGALSLVDQQNADWISKNIPQQERKQNVGDAQLVKTLLYLPSFEKPMVEERDKETHLIRNFFINLESKSVFVSDDATSGIDDPKRCLIKKRNIQINNWKGNVITLIAKLGAKSVTWSSAVHIV